MTPSDYASLLATCKITDDPNKLKELNYITKVALANRALYWSVQNGAKTSYGRAVPWALIAAIHFRESDQDFTKHLHNGDPLGARTVHVRSGGPKRANRHLPGSKAPLTLSAVDGFLVAGISRHVLNFSSDGMDSATKSIRPTRRIFGTIPTNTKAAFSSLTENSIPIRRSLVRVASHF